MSGIIADRASGNPSISYIQSTAHIYWHSGTPPGFFALERTLLIDAHAQNSVIFTANRLTGFSLAHPMFTSSTAFAIQ